MSCTHHLLSPWPFFIRHPLLTIAGILELLSEFKLAKLPPLLI